MEVPSTSDLKNELHSLQLAFHQQLPDKISEIEYLCSAICQNSGEHVDINNLLRLMQNLANASKAFSALSISHLVQQLAVLLPSQPTENELATPFSKAIHQQIDALIEQLKNAAKAWQPSEFNYPQNEKTNEQGTSNLVYLHDRETQLIPELITDIERADFRVKHFTEIGEMESAYKQEVPVAIIMGIALADDSTADIKAVKKLTVTQEPRPPIISLSGHDDIEARLNAVRAGNYHYFRTPVDTIKLIQTLNDVARRVNTNPYRALLIIDDEVLQGFYSTVLRYAGIDVECHVSPLEILVSLDRFQPDTVIMDRHLKEYQGPELTQIIRQEDTWAQLPIIFTPAIPKSEYQIEATSLSYSEPQSNPDETCQLVAEITAKAKRARWTEHVIKKKLAHIEKEKERQLFTMNQHDIVSTTDVAGRIISVNDKFCEISGFSREELLGQNHRILKSGIHSRAFYEDVWRTISAGKVWHGSICNRKKNQDIYWVESTIVPFLDSQGKPYKYMSARTDITALTQSEERLHRSQTFANIGTWDWNIVNGDLFWSDRIAPLFGYAEGMLETTYENFLNAVHPDDRQMVSDAVNNCVSQRAEYNIEHRVVWPDGSEHWLHESGDVVRDEDGTPLRMLGVVQNIDKRKRTELALADSERQLRDAQTLAKMGNWQADLRSGELSWSDEVYRIFGHLPGDFKPSIDAFKAAIHPDDLAWVNENEKEAGLTGLFNVEHRIIRPDDTVAHVHELARAEVDKSGNPLRLTGSVQDITARVQMETKLSQQKKLLDMLHHSMTDFMRKKDYKHTQNSMLNTLLELTESEYGFTGEVLYDDAGSPYLKTDAMTNIAWDDETQKVYEQTVDEGFEFHNLNTLFGEVMTSQRFIISNNPAQDPRAGGLPKGHPPLLSFLGIPIFYGEELVGMYGLANRKNGYDDEIQKLLSPFDITYGVLIHSKRMLTSEENNRKALIEAKEDAEEANHAKSQFLASMSHELRTPMNAIIGFSQLLQMETDDPLSESQQDNVEEIVTAGKHLLNLINEVLDLAKIEEGHIDLTIESVTIGYVVAESLQLIMPLAQKRGIEITLRSNDADITLDALFQLPLTVMADNVRLRQVLLNLLSNAVKYNRENGKISITCAATNSQNVRISITDTGAGLTGEQQTQLFSAFNRLGAEHSAIEGTGIGLVITKNIIDLMGGDIGVESKYGTGSTFWITLPSGGIVNTQNQQNHDDPTSVESQVQKRTVLYIEDNPANLRLVTRLLGHQPNIQIWSAHEPLLGLELAAEHKPDLILLDINLPGMDGFQVLEKLRKQESTRHTPIIALSANAMPRDIEKGLNAGFNDYITKPINVKKLLHAVETTLQEHA